MIESTPDWKSKFKRMWSMVRVAERAEALRQSHSRFSNVNSLTYDTRRLLMGDKATHQASKDDEMKVGDSYTTITNEASQWPKVIAQIAMAAGIGGGAYFLADAIRNRPIESTTVIEQQGEKNTDTDTSIILSLPDLPAE